MVLYIFRRESPFCFLAKHGQWSSFLSHFYKFVIRLEFKCHIKFQNGARELSNLKKAEKRKWMAFTTFMFQSLFSAHVMNMARSGVLTSAQLNQSNLNENAGSGDESSYFNLYHYVVGTLPAPLY